MHAHVVADPETSAALVGQVFTQAVLEESFHWKPVLQAQVFPLAVAYSGHVLTQVLPLMV